MTNNQFYADIKASLGCKKITVQKYIRGLLEKNLLIKIGNDGRNGQIILDGFYTPIGTGWSKKPVIIKDKAIMQALRTFKPI